jgi:general secretion pathway protein D
MAVDNVEEKYKVGTNIPFQKGLSFPTTTSGSSPFNSVGTNIDRKDLVLELDIKPHISASDSVLLEVKHNAQSLQGSSSLGPTWSTRAMETRVLVRDQDTIVLGGLMQEEEISSSTKVPILGDIPLLGYLFKYTKKEKKKTNLLVMLTPYIIKDTLDLQQIRERKQREHDEFASAFASLNGMHYQPAIDYGKKRGLVEEINRAILGVEDDRAALRDVQPPKHVEGGAVR